VKKLYLIVRSGILWPLSILHFFIAASILIAIGTFTDPRKTDFLQRYFSRTVLRLAGVKFQVRRAPGFDPNRTSIFVSNHVNIFDPFVVYSAVPQFIRGWELEDHFRVPVYGWMMKRFGNIPVASDPTPTDIKNLLRQTRASLDSGMSLVVFAEGGRTRDGHVRPFRDGIFRMLRQLPYPIVPMSIVGSFDFYRKGGKIFYPSTIVVHLHDTIETADMKHDKEQAKLFREHVYQIVAEPVEEHMSGQSQS
jgi:1-acyl-sn-glycerol-3-phosphate acyltransferase